jgi:hypothetical protein
LAAAAADDDVAAAEGYESLSEIRLRAKYCLPVLLVLLC